MDASYDGSFGSLSAGGKGPGEGDFGGLKNGGANDSGEIKIERSRDANTANNAGANAGGNAEKIELKNEPNSATGREEVYLHETAAKVPAENKAADAGAGNTAAPVALVASAEKAAAPAASAVTVAPAENAAAESAAVSATPAIPVEKMPASAENAAASTASAAPAGNAPTSTPAMMGGMSNGMFGRMNSGMANGVNRNGANRNATIVSVGTGGVNLPNAEQKKPKKGLIIGVIVVLLLAAVGAFVAMNLSGRRGDSDQVVTYEPLRESFNSYMNYVLYGEDSEEDIDLNTIGGIEPYFLEVKKSGEGKEEYLAKAEEKYTAFMKSYYKDVVIDDEDDVDEKEEDEEEDDEPNKEETSELSVYFQDYVAVGMSSSELVKKYLELGYDETVKLVEESYKTDNTNQLFLEYVNADKERNLLELKIVAQTNGASCIGDDTLIVDCYDISDDLRKQYEELWMKSYRYSSSLKENAINTLENIYGEINITSEGKDEE